ncbi:MAG: PEGA domain-containing protein [Planctomycetota bacterium]|nr:PEGA domain-containing protein [Planctomycetota bacterium]
MQQTGSAAKAILTGLVSFVVVAVLTYVVFASTGFFESTASVKVISSPPGAAVVIDDEPAGTTPLELDNVQPGVHEFRFILRGYRPAVISRVCVDEIAVEAKLEKLPSAQLDVKTMPDGARVFIDGVDKGRTPLTCQLSPGTHNLSVLKENYDEEMREVKLADGDSKSILLELVPSVESFYTQAIKTSPNDLINYADLIRYYFVKEQYEDVSELVYEGMKVVFEGQPEREGLRRFQQELKKLRAEYEIYTNKLFPKLIPKIRKLAIEHPGRGETMEWLVMDKNAGMEMLFKLIEENPDVPGFRMYLAQTNAASFRYLQRLNAEELEKLIELVINSDEFIEDRETLFNIYRRFATTCISLKHFKGAEKALRKAIDVFPENGRDKDRLLAYYHLVVTLRNQELYDEAIKICEKMLAEDPPRVFKSIFQTESKRAKQLKQKAPK